MTTSLNKRPIYNLILFFILITIGFAVFSQSATAKGETYKWTSDSQVLVKGGKLLDNKTFTTTDWRVTDDAANGKRAIYRDKNGSGRITYTSGGCNMYLALEFTKKDGTQANLVRATSLAEAADDDSECERSDNTYLGLSDGILQIKTTSISVVRPSTLVKGDTLEEVLIDGNTDNNTDNNTAEPTYQCGSLPQWLCDQATGTIADPNNPLGGIRPLIDFIANIMVGLFGSIIVLIIIASGVQIAASGGNEEAVKKGKENIFKAVTGLVLLISFRAIIEIINSLFDGVDTGTLFDASGNLAAGGVPLIIKNAIGIASFFAGVVSVIFIIIGGIQYTTSGGGEGLKKAKKTITYAVAGLVISLSAYGILVFIQNQLQK